MSTVPTSIAELAAHWGTIGEFASEVGCGYEAARKMIARGRVAPRHWLGLISASEKKGIAGITAEWLGSQYGKSASFSDRSGSSAPLGGVESGLEGAGA